MTTARFSTAATDRYGAVAQWLHWITAILVLATLPLAWVMIKHGAQTIPRSPRCS